MKQYTSLIRVATVVAAIAFTTTAYAQGARGGGRGGIPGITPEQTAKINELFTTGLAAETAAVTAARTELATATFADKKDEAAIKAAVEKVKAAELALANKRAAAFATLQGSPEMLNPEQVTAFVNAGGVLAAGRGGAGGGGGGGGRAGGAAGGGARGGQ